MDLQMSTSISEVVMETSLFRPVESKQVQKVDRTLHLCFCSPASPWFIRNRTVRYRTASVHLVHTRTLEDRTVPYRIIPISGSPPFLYCPISRHVLQRITRFFRPSVNATPLRTIFWNGPNGPKWTN